MIRAAILTISNRAADGVYEDRSGPLLVDGVREWGWQADARLVHDGPEVEQALRALIPDHDVILTSGGTGISPTDLTPEMTLRVVEQVIPGISEALRHHGASAGIPTAMLSRGVAGVAGRTLIINLPGSPSAARDALAILRPVIEHAIDQLGGGDHTS